MCAAFLLTSCGGNVDDRCTSSGGGPSGCPSATESPTCIGPECDGQASPPRHSASSRGDASAGVKPPGGPDEAGVSRDAGVSREAGGSRDAGIRDASSLVDASPDSGAEDGLPPLFEGVASAEAITPTAVALTWLSARDESTDAGSIVYAVYFWETGAAVSTAPVLVTNPAELGALVTRLDRRKTYNFMVRARDASGNEDTNSVVLTATTLTSFELDVQPVFTRACTGPGCHAPGNPPQGLVLIDGFSYNGLVDSLAGEGPALDEPDLKRVDSHSSDPDDSYLWRKIQERGEAVISGAPMLPEINVPALTPDERSSIEDWIVQGAKRN